MSNTNKILLAMLPYWTPLIPPQGISHLKHFLQHHGYSVKTLDANTEESFKELYNTYFGTLRKYVPPEKRGNFFNIGHDVLRNHMLAFIDTPPGKEYLELVESIVYKTYYTRLDGPGVEELNRIVTEFFKRLKAYVLHWLDREKPGVFGLSVPRDSIGPSLYAFRVAKEHDPSIRTVIGGSIFTENLLRGTPNFENFIQKTPYIDAVIIGEGQKPLLKWLRGEMPGRQKVFTLQDAGGDPLGFSPLNVPDMTDFDTWTVYPYLAAQGSASCPNKCSFCNVKSFYGEYRQKDPKQLAREMNALYKKYGAQMFFMNDALLNTVAPGLTRELLDADLSFYWDGYLKVDASVLNPDNPMEWRRGGFYRARLGVESGSQFVLDKMDKGITPDQTKEALYNLAAAGIKTTAYWVIGHPGETEEDFLKTLALVEEIKDYIYESECNPFIFGFTGQGGSSMWEDKRKLLYPESGENGMLLKSWTVDTPPSREETYRRVNRFVRHCDKLGVPNPYTMQEIYLADARWKKLHKNAVPPLVDFLPDKNNKRTYIRENLNVKKTVYAEKVTVDKGGWGF